MTNFRSTHLDGKSDVFTTSHLSWTYRTDYERVKPCRPYPYWLHLKVTVCRVMVESIPNKAKTEASVQWVRTVKPPTFTNPLIVVNLEDVMHNTNIAEVQKLHGGFGCNLDDALRVALHWEPLKILPWLRLRK